MFFLTKNNKLSLFSVIFCLGINHPVIGSHPFEMGNLLISSVMAFSIIIWGFYFFLKENYFLGFFIIGFSSFIHISHSYLVYGILIFSVIFTKYDFRNKFLCKSELMRKGLIILNSLSFFIGFFLSLIVLLKGYGSQVLSDKEMIYLFHFRAPWHYFAFFDWKAFEIVFYLFMILFFFLSWKYSKINLKNKKIFLNLFFGTFIFYFLEIIFTRIFPLKIFSQIHFFRLSTFLDIIISIFILEFLFRLLMFLKNLFHKLFFLERNLNKKKEFYILISLLIIIFLINLGALQLFNEGFRNFFSNRFPLLIVFLIFTNLFLFDIYWLKKILMASLIIFLVIFLLLNPLIGRNSYDPSINELFDFVKENIPKDATLLVPPDSSIYRIGTQRAIVVDHKSFPYGETEMLEWYSRILDVTGTEELKFIEGIDYKKDILPKYYDLSLEDINYLKSKYGVSYAIFDSKKKLKLKKIFENENYIIYEI
jgi:hypothetical protein